MSVEFLRQVAAAPLPKSFNAKRDVDAVQILRRAGLVLATVDEAPEFGAKVLAITEKGRAELLQFHYPEGPASSFVRDLRLPTVAQRARNVLKRSIGAG